MLTEGLSIDAKGGGRFGAHLQLPARGRGPVVMVAQEIFGVNPFMTEVLAWLASEGFVGLCPDLYWRHGPGIEFDPNDEVQRARALGMFRDYKLEDGVADLRATVAYAASQPFCDGGVAVIGYCLGGALAYEVAAEGFAQCCVGYYGVGFEKRLERARLVKTPSMFHMGTNDHFVTAEARQLITNAFEANPAIALHWYDAGHSFARASSPNFSPEATRTANARTLEMLKRMKPIGTIGQ
uniref:Carboxymethylenebutenolidase n=1 Tax=Pseudomonas sp. (strain P51) TaxID=65067 RepID=TCBE_PSESQ|nr:RecName: Full=Carboxymethylenebutenolidase; AltName: Full=Dienelactone hydrolase; Short=DLH [Pseudomonas sp. P51]AAD13628.1 hydrolase II [Pseudomonas sp.]